MPARTLPCSPFHFRIVFPWKVLTGSLYKRSSTRLESCQRAQVGEVYMTQKYPPSIASQINHFFSVFFLKTSDKLDRISFAIMPGGYLPRSVTSCKRNTNGEGGLLFTDKVLTLNRLRIESDVGGVRCVHH